ncbi:MAG TPA: helix-turn-helix transcriptional regulator [Ilumatobacteraceae bacterium]|nr:helix-turn-helix transcriptional regulator [Ilumatobacteraceae bacterium]
MGIAEFSRARDRLLACDRAAPGVQIVCAEIVRAFHDVASFDMCSVMTTDPETLLPSGGVVEGFGSDDCAPFWDNELVDADFVKFNQLARSTDPVATLAEAVDGDLERSPRYRKLYAAAGASDEMRVAFVAGSSCLAVGVFVRLSGAGWFRPEELADVRQLVPIATTVLRRALGQVAHDASSRPPAVIMLDAEGKVTATTPGGTLAIEELRTALDDTELPSIIRAAATKARWSRSASNLTTRVRDGSGRWLRLHITPVDGEVGAVAVVVETARPDDIVMILLESYGLTERETDVVLLLARGLSLKEIALELCLSVHTIRDHLKSIYAKAGVNSRGELVAVLFSNHVLDQFHNSVEHIN